MVSHCWPWICGSSPPKRGTRTEGVSPTGVFSGSSPPKRGTLRPLAGARQRHRFIPAQAGNTRSSRGWPPARAVHPRPSGEHGWVKADTGLRRGSSPPKRGTLLRDQALQGVLRFIPAQAGNTAWRAPSSSTRPVHPRPSGEHVCWRDGPHGPRRFIPAQAGNTASAPRKIAAMSVHPRPSGEHGGGLDIAFGGNGSSPPKRGTRARRRTRAARGRFIPAQAGNTSARPGIWSASTVHPRPSGEHVGWVGVGSADGRFIPAQAGNTRDCWH